MAVVEELRELVVGVVGDPGRAVLVRGEDVGGPRADRTVRREIAADPREAQVDRLGDVHRGDVDREIHREVPAVA